MKDRHDDVAALAALNEPARRRLYGYVRQRGTPVTREEAAGAMGISVNLAAFHLDKLVGVGLLKAHYGRVPDAPPQRGRSPKLYQVSGTEITASLPARRYDLSGEILLDAIEAHHEGENIDAAVLLAAHARGVKLARRVLTERPGEGRASPADLAQQVLEEHGFEPYLDETSTLRLRNCPFHRLAERSRDLVCSMNLAFIQGLLRGLNDEKSEATLAPAPGHCCVAISTVDPETAGKELKGGTA